MRVKYFKKKIKFPWNGQNHEKLLKRFERLSDNEEKKSKIFMLKFVHLFIVDLEEWWW